MTPVKLLESVKKRFVTLLHREDSALMPLLNQALVTFQDKAGAKALARISRAQITDGEFDLPKYYLSRVGCKGANGGFIRHDVVGNKVDLNLNDLQRCSYPLKFTYLLNFSDVDIDDFDIPETAVGIISDYLYVLIQIPNSERLRRVATASTLDSSDIPAESDLQARKVEIEQSMKRARCMFSVTSV